MDSPALGLTAFGLLALPVLLFTNAYFVAIEFALVAVRRTQVEVWVSEGRRGAAAVAYAIEHLDDAIAATQLGITLASIGLGFLCESVLAGLIEPVWASVGVAEVGPLASKTSVRDMVTFTGRLAFLAKSAATGSE